MDFDACDPCQRQSPAREEMSGFGDQSTPGVAHVSPISDFQRPLPDSRFEAADADVLARAAQDDCVVRRGIATEVARGRLKENAYRLDLGRRLSPCHPASQVFKAGVDGRTQWEGVVRVAASAQAHPRTDDLRRRIRDAHAPIIGGYRTGARSSQAGGRTRGCVRLNTCQATPGLA
jgi:hypothetical protein